MEPAPKIIRVKVSKAGAGQPGYCKVCAVNIAPEINRRLARGDTQRKVIAWGREQGFDISTPTMRKHLRHITDPKTTFVEMAKADPAIRRVTHDEFLRTLVDLGAARVNEDPGSVTINHAIRAAAMLEARRDKDRDAINILVLSLSGNLPPQVVHEEPKLLEGVS